MIIMIIVIIIMAVFIGISEGSEAKVELNGDQEFSRVWVCICLRLMGLIWGQKVAKVVGPGVSTSLYC